MPKLNSGLCVRTHFSLGESVLSPKDVRDICEEEGVADPVIVDTMTISSLIETSKLRSEKFDPAFGVRLLIVDDLSIRDKKAKQLIYSLKVYPTSYEGLQVIMRLLSRAFDEDHFYYHARLSFDDVYSALESEGVVVSTGDVESIFVHPDASEKLTRLADKIGWSNLYCELGAMNTLYQDRVNCEAIKFYKNTGEKAGLVVTSYTAHKSKEKTKWIVSRAVQTKSTFAKKVFVNQPASNFHLTGQSEFLDCVKACVALANKRLGEDTGALWRRGLVSDFRSRLTYRWSAQPISLPNLASDPDEKLLELCKQGLKERATQEVFGYVPSPSDLKEKYLPRLKHELGILKDMGFANYFLVVDDLVRWSKENGIIVGPGRGSVGGSLVAFCLGITEVDPIRFDLLFERFINPSRNDLPDIDLDFMSTRRGEVITYLEEKHGTEFVAGISNYGELGSASSLRDTGRVFNIPQRDMSVSSLVPKEHGQPVSLEEAREQVAEIAMFADRFPKIWSTATKLQGTMRNYSKHAAGVVVSGVPLTDRAVVERRSGERIICWDKRVSEDMGLVKLDILGLQTLDIIGKAQDHIAKRHKPIDVTAIPLDDEKTLRMFSEGRTLGIFQFEGGAARKLLKSMAKVSDVTFDDLVAANALNRPGPIDAGLVDKYVNAKNGDEAIEEIHHSVDGVLGETFGVMTYQEQIMKITQTLSGFTGSEADTARKAIGKKDLSKMKDLKPKFVEGAVAGYVEVELDDGRIISVHAKSKHKVNGSDRLVTVQEALDEGLDISITEV